MSTPRILPTLGPLPTSHGGTGGDSPAAARDALGLTALLAGKSTLVRFATLSAATAALPEIIAGADRIELSGVRAPGDCLTPLVYVPLGTDPAQIRPWHLQLSGGRWFELRAFEVCPEALGADGTPAGDTAALQACQDYSARVIRTPSTTYRLIAAGLVLSSSKTWIGDATIVRAASVPDKDMVLALYKSDITIRGVTFDGAGLLTQTSGSYTPDFSPAIYLGGCTRVSIQQCRVIGFRTCGILLNETQYATVSGCHVEKSDPTGVYANYGICAVGGTSHTLRIDANVCIGADIACGAHDSWITRNEVSGWGFSAGINIAVDPGCYGLTISENICHDCLRIPDRDNYAMDGIECWAPATICTGNHCYRCIGSGIGWGSRRGTCSGNHCYDNGMTQAEFTALGLGPQTILGQGILALYNNDGFSGADDSLVTGNNLYDTRTGPARTQSYGYREVSYHNFSGVVVYGNKLANHGLGEYSLSGTGRVDFLAWPGGSVAYTPAVEPESGALGAPAAVSASYEMVTRKLCWVTMTIFVGDNGTGAGSVRVGLPFPARAGRQQSLSGGETAVNGSVLFGLIPDGGAVVAVKSGGNQYPGGSGMRLVLTGTYEIS